MSSRLTRAQADAAGEALGRWYRALHTPPERADALWIPDPRLAFPLPGTGLTVRAPSDLSDEEIVARIESFLRRSRSKWTVKRRQTSAPPRSLELRDRAGRGYRLTVREGRLTVRYAWSLKALGSDFLALTMAILPLVALSLGTLLLLILKVWLGLVVLRWASILWRERVRSSTSPVRASWESALGLERPSDSGPRWQVVAANHAPLDGRWLRWLALPLTLWSWPRRRYALAAVGCSHVPLPQTERFVLVRGASRETAELLAGRLTRCGLSAHAVQPDAPDTLPPELPAPVHSWTWTSGQSRWVGELRGDDSFVVRSGLYRQRVPLTAIKELRLEESWDVPRLSIRARWRPTIKMSEDLRGDTLAAIATALERECPGARVRDQLTPDEHGPDIRRSYRLGSSTLFPLVRPRTRAMILAWWTLFCLVGFPLVLPIAWLLFMLTRYRLQTSRDGARIRWYRSRWVPWTEIHRAEVRTLSQTRRGVATTMDVVSLLTQGGPIELCMTPASAARFEHELRLRGIPVATEADPASDSEDAVGTDAAGASPA